MKKREPFYTAGGNVTDTATMEDSMEILLKIRNKTTMCCVLVAKLCPTLSIPWTVPARLLCPWDSPGKNTGEGCHFFPWANPGLLHCRQMIYQLSYEGSPAMTQQSHS